MMKILAWSIYDFANTIFAMNIISLYFALWVTVDMKGPDILYSCALSGSMLLSALSAPIMGALSDRLGKRMPFLITYTIICCVFTAIIGWTNHLFVGLFCFIIANYCYQLADIFYNSLLPHVSERRHIGRVSGYGVSLGYFGTIVGLALVSPFVLKYGRPAAFLPTSLFFLIFALPCFIFVKDPKAIHPDKNQLKASEIIQHAFNKTKSTLLNIKQYSTLFYFLISAFISLNAINTIYIFMSIYIKKVMGFTDAQMLMFYMISSGFAIAGSFVVGFITDKLGSKKTLTGVLLLWCFTVFLTIFTFNPKLFWLIGPLAGICLGSTWTSSRALVVDLSPPYMIGEVFGFYGLVGKSASIVGPLVWGVSVWSFGFLGLLKYRIAVAILLLFLILGLIILQKVPNKVNSYHERKKLHAATKTRRVIEPILR